MTELEHAFPLDDFLHWRSMDCPCEPVVEHFADFRFPPHIVHRRIEVEPVPETFPESWADEGREA
jgi:hypothetical protein